MGLAHEMFKETQKSKDFEELKPRILEFLSSDEQKEQLISGTYSPIYFFKKGVSVYQINNTTNAELHGFMSVEDLTNAASLAQMVEEWLLKEGFVVSRIGLWERQYAKIKGDWLGQQLRVKLP